MKNPLLIFNKNQSDKKMQGANSIMSACSNLSLISVATELNNISDHKSGDLTVRLITNDNHKTGLMVVRNDDKYVIVTFLTTDNWLLSETHLAVSGSPEFLPYKTAYIFPGTFPHYRIFNPPVKKDSYTIALRWETKTVIYLAAHAYVNKLYPAGYISANKRVWAYDGPSVHKDRMSYFTYTING